jgi:hypothetical protein
MRKLFTGMRAPGAGAALVLVASGALAAAAAPPHVDAADIGGVVTSTKGPEAGVWVIAETGDLGTRFMRIVVTDDQGRYLVPDLPAAKYSIWVRGYGLADSAKVDASPGKTVNLTAQLAANPAQAAKIYPAAYWYAMMKLPTDEEVAHVRAGKSGYLMLMKSMGCVSCHQMGNLATRTFPPSLSEYAGHSKEAWMRRIQSGQSGADMASITMDLLAGVPIKYLSDWTDRIAAGEVPSSAPSRPSGVERNVVATVWDWGDPKTYVHDLSGTDRNNPTVNGYGKLYGSTELSTDNLPILDPLHSQATTWKVPVRDADTPSSGASPVIAPSPYWGSEAIWDSKATVQKPALDSRGRVWFTARIRGPANPAFCQQGSSHPSAKLYPVERSDRQVGIYDPKTGHYAFVDTCFGTHQLAFAADAQRTLWMSGRGQVIGWLDTKRFDATGDAASAQHWAPLVLDTSGNGKLDEWTEPDQPADPKKDQRLALGFYAIMPSPVDGSVWGSLAYRYPGALLRFDPKTMLTERYNVPAPGFGVRGADIDKSGVVWVSLSSGHLGEFDRRKCKGPLNGPGAIGDHCPEGWTLHRLPGPGFVQQPQSSVESSYYTWVDQHDTLGLGANVPIATGNLFDGAHAWVNGQFVTLRIPYPLGFYAKGMEGRIDDPKAGWKGRGLWMAEGDRTPWHKEGGKGAKPIVVHFQVRPDPLAD